MKYTLGMMDTLQHKDWQEALASQDLHAWIFDKREKAHAAIQGAILAATCLTGNSKSLRFIINGKELDATAIKQIEKSIGM